MGQRHQLYVRIENPTNGLYNENVKKEFRKVFGSNKYSIIALHHQWLYGASALGMVKHILNITDKDKLSSSNPFNYEYIGYNTSNGLESYIDKVMSMLQVITDEDFPRGIGIEGMHFLNTESLDYTKDFTLGDNNDGISIIDTINRKYCFMNIGNQYDDDVESVNKYEPYKPLSGEEYVSAYYPNDEEVIQNATNWLSDYKVLTKSEVLKISKNAIPKVLD